MKNKVIKVLNQEHGKKVIEFWKSKGINTYEFTGCTCEDNRDECIYYGNIDGIFNSWSFDIVSKNKAEIIELPEENEYKYHSSKFNCNENNNTLAMHDGVLETNTNEKEIIGYLLCREEYRIAVRAILESSKVNYESWFDVFFDSNVYKYGYNFGNQAGNIGKSEMENAGVMHWFKPIYKRTITLKSGIILSEEDIQEIKEILNK